MVLSQVTKTLFFTVSFELTKATGLDGTVPTPIKGAMPHLYNTYTCTNIYQKDAFDAFINLMCIFHLT